MAISCSSPNPVMAGGCQCNFCSIFPLSVYCLTIEDCLFSSTTTLTNGDSSPIPLPPPQPLGEGKETSPAPSTASTSKYTFSSSGLGEVGQSESVQPGVDSDWV